MFRIEFPVVACLVVLAANVACATDKTLSAPNDCVLVKDRSWGPASWGPAGDVAVEAQIVVEGLEVPWALGFLPNGDWLVTERAGRLRLVRNGRLVAKPVAEVAVAKTQEGGLLGLAVDPQFDRNRFIYLYVTSSNKKEAANQVERWKLSEDHATATRDKVLLAGIPSATFHDGGRLKFGPDGMLYAGTGDARQPVLSRTRNSLAGKILRMTSDGKVPADNPFPGLYPFIVGIRNTQGFDWRDEETLYVVDHGPSGDTGRTGGDEVNVARKGEDLGWPDIYQCETRPGLVTPSLAFETAAPPGGAAIYRGTRIPEWRNSLVVGTLGSRHLHLVSFDSESAKVARHATYFLGEPPAGWGRLRDVTMGPDDELYVTTSNCDGRGVCPTGKDKILRILPATDGGKRKRPPGK